MRNRWLLSLVLAMVASVQFASAQTTSSTDNRTVEQRLESLERKLADLEARVDRAIPDSAAKAATTSAPEVSDRLTTLDQKLQVLERSRQEHDEALAKSKQAPVVTAGRDGFSISAADKSYRLKLGGYAQADGKTFYDDRSHAMTDSFSVRRARLNFDGSLGKYIDFRLAPEFGNGSVLLYDAYADLKYQPYAVLRGGKFKTPLGMEMLQNDTELTFIERGLPSDLVPNRDEGFQVFGDFAGRFTYQVAAVNGAADGANIDGDTNDGKDVVARVFATPFASSGPAALRGLGFGLGASSGRQNGAVLPSLKSNGQATFFSYVTGATAAGRRLRYTPQAYYYNGPFGLVAEYVESAQTVSALAGKNMVIQSITNHAWQVAGSWVLTGEQKSYRGVLPRKGLEGGTNGPGFGAWEIAARISELNVDPMAFALKFADPTKSAEAARAWTVGVNWYLNKNAKLSFDYEQTHFEAGAVQANRPTEKVFEQRLQVVF